jgi:hypothetical protein
VTTVLTRTTEKSIGFTEVMPGSIPWNALDVGTGDAVENATKIAALSSGARTAISIQ